MKPFGKFFNQPLLVVLTVMLVAALAMPYSASAMLALQTYDFNTCELPGGWTLVKSTATGGSTAVTEGAYSGESYLKLTLPQGSYGSIKGGNTNAPRLETTITDTSFEVEVKFLAPQISTTAETKIEGLVFRDASELEDGVQDGDEVEWLRVDFHSTSNVLKSFATYLKTTGTGGYVDGSEDNQLPIANLPGGPTTTSPVLMRVKYDQPTGVWTVTYTVNGTATEKIINEANFGNAFTPTHMGIFVATSETGAPGHETRVDYIHLLGSDLNDDTVKLTVNKVGNGTVTQQSCVGNVVTLLASPGPGATFTGWSGDATGTATTVDVTMNASKTVTATFSGGLNLPLKLYVPVINR